MTNKELDFIISAIREVANNHIEWGKEYSYNKKNNEFVHLNSKAPSVDDVKDWFVL